MHSYLPISDILIYRNRAFLITEIVHCYLPFTVALKEAGETDYWLNVMIAGGDLGEEIYKPLNILLKEVISMLVVSLKTAKKNGQ